MEENKPSHSRLQTLSVAVLYVAAVLIGLLSLLMLAAGFRWLYMERTAGWQSLGKIGESTINLSTALLSGGGLVAFTAIACFWLALRLRR